MDNYPVTHSTNELSLNDSLLKYENDVVIKDSSSKFDSTTDSYFDLSFSGSSLDGLGLCSFGVINPNSVKAVLDNNQYSPQKRLMLWHSLCSPEYLDVFSSLGVSDTTSLIHGESLIVYICCLAHKEGHNLFDFSYGPQTLQFTYRVDRFLFSFMKSGGKVKLVFFEIFKKVFDPTFSVSEENDTFFDGFLYYRQLLLCHFKRNNVPFLVFDNWLTDSRFFDYLADNEPACILLEDGSSFVYVFDTVYELLELPGKGQVNAENCDKYSDYLSNQNKVDRYSHAVNTLITQSLSNSLSVAYLFDITHNSQDFKAFISFSSNIHPPTLLHHQSSRLLLEQFSSDELGDSSTAEGSGLVVNLYDEVCKLGVDSVTLRDLLTCNYLKEYTKLSSSTEELDEEQNQLFLMTFKCLVLHNYVIDTLSLRDRCTKRVDVSSWSFYTEMVTATVDFMCCYSNQVFDSLFKLRYEELSELTNLDSTVSDVFDSNLFSTLLYLLCEYAAKHDDQVDESFLDLDQTVVARFDKFYRSFSNDGEGSFFPIKLDHLDYQYPSDECSYASTTDLDLSASYPDHSNHVDVRLSNDLNGTSEMNSKDGSAENGDLSVSKNSLDDSDLLVDYKYLKQISNKYLFLNNSFVNLYYKFDDKSLQWVKARPMDELVMIEKYFWRDPCTITERLECIDFHLNFDLKEKQQDLTKFAMRRSLQNQSKFAFLLAKYLGSSNLHHPIVIKLEHYWLHIKYMTLLSYSKTVSPAAITTKESNRSTKQTKSGNKPGKEAKGAQKDKLSKADLLKMKNAELQESKKLESDTNTLGRLEVKLSQTFNNDKTFSDLYTSILEHTDGPNRAVDLLSDFKWVKSILSTKNVQLMYIYKMIKRLYQCFSSYRLRIVKNSPGSFRKLQSMVLRLIFVYYNQYHKLMNKEIVLFLYMFLVQLNFKSYAANLVKLYNSYQNENEVKESSADKPSKKSSKKGSTKSAKEAKSEEESKNVITQKELDKVHMECTEWDFVIFDDCEFNYMLCYMGDLFERTLGSTNDPRVLFRPDAWQKMLLDVIDSRESALVVAPTSTGKTYICYYAMEQVLRVDDHGMVIFVAPTTALALQVTYEITARFSNKYYTNPNLALSSIFLEKFHDPKWSSSQIVVTVPTILEKLLISMRNNESNFASRLEYIIFDEVHCISDVEFGTFMERCIHLIPCPFLALSATIGNALEFHNWLSKISKYNNPCAGSSVEGELSLSKVHFIQFDERYSDLKLEIYTSLHDPSDSAGSKSGKEKNKLIPFNPVCCMSYNDLVSNGFPTDVYLTPYDSFILFQALMLSATSSAGSSTSLKNKLLENFEYLEPRNYFNGCTLITKRQYRYYLETFKIELTNQINLKNIDAETYQQIMYNINLLSNSANISDLDDKYKLYPHLQPKHVLDHLNQKKLDKLSPQEGIDSNPELNNAVSEPDSPNKKVVNRDIKGFKYGSNKSDDAYHFLNDEDSLEYLNENSFYDMLRRLQNTKRLPCLVFILDRNMMEHVLISVTKLIMRLQWEKFFGTPERTLQTKLTNKARMEKYQMLLKQYEAEKKMRASASKEQREMEGITSNIELEMPVEPVDVSQDYDPEFYFYNRRTYVNYTDEIEKFINVAATSISNRKNANLYIEALKRGIGIHHEGFPHKFTMLTETLLRLGFLNVIISSRSLAFGINVPCKSVLFCGDNYELTPLMFKQMSGRCGRRGFDLSGHVIFWSISKKRIKQLLLTKLPTLTTNFNNINLSMLLTILSSFYTLIIKSNSAQGLNNFAFLNKKSEDYLDIRDDLITNSRKMSVEPKLLVQRLSSILNNSLNHFTSNRSEKDDSAIIVLLVRMVLEILLNCGMVDENGLIRGCYELALLMRDIHPSNILLSKLVQNSTFTKLLELYSETRGSKADAMDASFQLLEMLCILVYRKKEMSRVLNIRRLVSTNIRNGTNGPNVKNTFACEATHSYQVAYPDTFPLLPYNSTIQKYIDYYNQMVLTTTSKYFGPHPSPGEATSDSNNSGVDAEANVNGTNDTNKDTLFGLYSKRNLYRGHVHTSNHSINVGGVLKHVQTCNELNDTWFELTSDLVPTIEGNFCTIVQLDSKFNTVKRFTTTFDNSYMCDYFTHGRFSVLRDANGLGQYAWTYLKRFIVFLQHFKFVLKTYTAHLSTDDLLFKNVRYILDKLEPMFNKI